jgi:hypothetical protein
MHEIKRVANESTSGREDGQSAHRGDEQAQAIGSQFCQSLTSQPVRISNAMLANGADGSRATHLCRGYVAACIDGKPTGGNEREHMSQCGQRGSFKRSDTA